MRKDKTYYSQTEPAAPSVVSSHHVHPPHSPPHHIGLFVSPGVDWLLWKYFGTHTLFAWVCWGFYDTRNQTDSDLKKNISVCICRMDTHRWSPEDPMTQESAFFASIPWPSTWGLYNPIKHRFFLATWRHERQGICQLQQVEPCQWVKNSARCSWSRPPQASPPVE